ncbi:MAG: hypothetical protein ABI207_06970 [Crocinitomicaceae bacterium]
MIQFFKSNQIFSIISYVALGVAWCLFSLFVDKILLDTNFGLWGDIPFLDSLWVRIVILISILINALLINQLFNRHEFYNRKSFLNGFIYLVLVSSTPIFQDPSITLSHFFVICSLMILLEINQHADAKKNIFNGTFLMVLGVSLNSNLLPLVLFPLLVLFISRVFIWREFALYLLGIIVPHLYIFAFLYFHKEVYSAVISRWIHLNIAINFSPFEWTFVFLVAFLGIFSFIMIQRKAAFSSIRFKQINRLIWILLPLTIISDLIGFFQYEMYVFISAIPLSIIFAMGALFLKRTRFFEIIFLLLCISIVCLRWIA